MVKGKTGAFYNGPLPAPGFTGSLRELPSAPIEQ